ncbi:hypothetical protein ABZ905_32315 [Streptomyces parvus]|uniref:hypothetical protein n=1 Tax=Streptomyces parvus TaxID=66428 RepID=UPI00340FF038
MAEDLAERMDYSTGEVRYCRNAMAARLGLGKATIARHVGYLRAMGCLVWVVRGSRTNVRRALGLPGYAATATVYAAVIPPAYDHALGHTVIGSGYAARIVIDQRRQQTAAVPAQAVSVDNPAVEASRSGPGETPSLTVEREEGKGKVEGGRSTSTSQARTEARVIRRKPKKRLTTLGYRITPERVGRARQMAAEVRPLVNWVQGASLNELSWVLLDLVARDRSTLQVVVWLQHIGQACGAVRRRPRKPHRVIAAALLRADRATPQHVHHDHQPYESAADHTSTPNTDFMAAVGGARRTLGPQAGSGTDVVEYPALEAVPLDHWDRGAVLDGLESDPALVLSYAQHCGYAEAVAVYGDAGARILDRALEAQGAGLPLQFG